MTEPPVGVRAGRTTTGSRTPRRARPRPGIASPARPASRRPDRRVGRLPFLGNGRVGVLPSWASSAGPFRSWNWPTPSRLSLSVWARAGLRAAFAVLAFVLAGWGVAVLARVTAAAILEYLERAARLSDDLSMRRLEDLLCSSGSHECAGAASVSRSPRVRASGLDRARSMAEIVRAAQGRGLGRSRDAIE